MKSKYNLKENTFTVTIKESELQHAFTSEENYLEFLHNIVLVTYGESFADILFPMEKGAITK